MREGLHVRLHEKYTILTQARFRLAFALLLCTLASGHAMADPWMDADYFRARVVIPQNASPTIINAAEDFTRCWQMCTGEAIEFGTDREGTATIWLGREVMPDSLVKPGELDGLGDQGFVIRSYSPTRRDNLYLVGSHLVIAGKTDEATRHAVFEFFHRFLNIRWYAPGETQATFVENAGVPEATLRYAPPFRFREVGYFGLWPKEKGMPEYRAAQHLPATFQPSGRRYPKEIAALPAPVAPLALDDAAVLASAADWLEKHKDANASDLPRGMRTHIWNDDLGHPVLSWNLNRIPALDPALDQLLENEPTRIGEVLGFANDVLGSLRKVAPETTTHVLLMLPPTSPLPPDGVKLDKQIIVQLSNAACDFSRPLLDAHTEANQHFLAALEAWSKTEATIFVSDHVASLRNNIAPFPNLHVLRANLYAYTQYGVSGVYAEAWDFPEAKLGEMDRLKAFLLATLLWNPDQVVEDLREGFITRYYGPAAKPVSGIVAAFQESLKQSGKPMTANGLPEWLLPDYVANVETLLGGALKLEMDNKYKNRVGALLSTLEYAQLLCPPALESLPDGTKLWRRPKSRTLEQIVERLRGRGLAEPSARLDLVAGITADCGGATPPREQPYVEGQEPK